jgi:hypothetical protein
LCVFVWLLRGSLYWAREFAPLSFFSQLNKTKNESSKTMKIFSALMLVAIVCSGCVATSYQKSIAVTKDANGKIISTTETETVVQPPNTGSQSLPIKFQYMKDWWQ